MKNKVGTVRRPGMGEMFQVLGARGTYYLTNQEKESSNKRTIVTTGR